MCATHRTPEWPCRATSRTERPHATVHDGVHRPSVVRLRGGQSADRRQVVGRVECRRLKPSASFRLRPFQPFRSWCFFAADLWADSVEALHGAYGRCGGVAINRHWRTESKYARRRAESSGLVQQWAHSTLWLSRHAPRPGSSFGRVRTIGRQNGVPSVGSWRFVGSNSRIRRAQASAWVRFLCGSPAFFGILAKAVRRSALNFDGA